MGCNENEVTDRNSDMYKTNPVYYTIEIYEDIGKSMMVSILDIFSKNPCSRIPNTQYQTLENVRREIALRISKYNRFKKEVGIRKKCNKIEDLVKEVFYDDFTKKNAFEDMFGKKRNTIINFQEEFIPKKPTTEKKQDSMKPLSLSITSITKRPLVDSKLILKSIGESPLPKKRTPIPNKLQSIIMKDSLSIETRGNEEDEKFEEYEEFKRMNVKNKNKALNPLPQDYIMRNQSIQIGNRYKLTTTSSIEAYKDSPKLKASVDEKVEYYSIEAKEEEKVSTTIIPSK